MYVKRNDRHAGTFTSERFAAVKLIMLPEGDDNAEQILESAVHVFGMVQKNGPNDRRRVDDEKRAHFLMKGIALAADAIIQRGDPRSVINKHKIDSAAFHTGDKRLIFQTSEVRQVLFIIAAIEVDESASIFQEFVADVMNANYIGGRNRSESPRMTEKYDPVAGEHVGKVQRSGSCSSIE